MPQQLEKRRLRYRIKRFYGLLKQRRWEQCFNLIDPKLRDGGNVTLDLYSKSLSAFFAAHGPLGDVCVGELKMCFGVRNKLYEDRDFALGNVVLHDRDERPHRVKERWVKADDGHWYTRMVGLV